MTSKNTDADLKAQVNQLRKTVTKNTALLNTLNNNVEALIHVLTPLFPRLSNSYNTNEAIERALDNEGNVLLPSYKISFLLIPHYNLNNK